MANRNTSAETNREDDEEPELSKESVGLRLPPLSSASQPKVTTKAADVVNIRPEKKGEDTVKELVVKGAAADEPLGTSSYAFPGRTRVGLTVATEGSAGHSTSRNLVTHRSPSDLSRSQGAQPAAGDLIMMNMSFTESTINDTTDQEECSDNAERRTGQRRPIATFEETYHSTMERGRRSSLASVSTLSSHIGSATLERPSTDIPDPRGRSSLHYENDGEPVIDIETFSSASSSPPSSPLSHSSRASSNGPSPASSRRQRQRPYSQFPAGRSLLHDLHHKPLPSSSDLDSDSLLLDQHVPLRRANSLPASRRSQMRGSQVSVSQIPSGSPLIFDSVASRATAESKGVGNDKNTTISESFGQQREQPLPQGLSGKAGLSSNDCIKHVSTAQDVMTDPKTGNSGTHSVIDLSTYTGATIVSPIAEPQAISSRSTPTEPKMSITISERPRRQSLLSPRQLEIMGQQQQQLILPHQQEKKTPTSNTNNQPQGQGPVQGGGTFSMKALASLLKDHNKKNDKKQKDNDSGSSTPGTTTDSKRSKVKPSKQPEKVPAQPQQFKPSAKTMPNIVFLPHSTEISTIRPSVSGRLLLQIPRVPGFKFHFVSLALHLKLKESISWTRQDLVSFEIEKHHWGQTVWEKKLMLEFQDKQVEEAKEIGLGTGGKTEATVEDHNTLPHGNAVSSHLDTKPDVPLATPDLIDEWRWEWFMAVTKNEARPESFEGSMGCVWYELEAKCLFRWDSVDKDGNVINPIVDQQPSTDASGKSSTGNASPSSKGTDSSQGKSQSGSSKLLKSLGVLGKLRVGNKSKKPQYAGDFKMPSQHEEYFKNSLKTGAEGGVSPGISTQSSSTKPPSTAMALFSLAFGRDDDEPEPPTNVSRTTPVPFQIRKSLKLYFTRPALRVSSNPAFFLPPPSMSLPTLPSTRRLKAIIPGARIQVQIQVPSIVPIPGYAYTSLLVPCPKTGSLIPIKSMNNPNTSVTARLAGGCHGHIQASGNAIITGAHPEGSYIRPRFGDNRLYPEDFQVALTVRKVTQYDINKCNILKRRYENAEAVANAANHHAGSPPTGGMSQGPYALRRLLSQQSGSSYTSGPDTATTEEPSDASGITGSTDSGQRQDRSWRKEIRVRHVKCEFWQKENCRIPTMDAPSRAIKTPLGSPFTYTEKENEKERQRTTSGTEADGLSPYTVPSSREETTTSTSNYSKSLSPNFLAVDDASSSSYSSGRETPFKPTTTSPLAQSPLSQQLRTVPNKPFMLLIPVPLDSPRIRQTYTWPSPESLSGYDASESILTDSSGFGYGSDLEYRSQGSMSEMTSGGSFSNWEGSRAYGGGSGVAIVGGYGNNNHLSSGTKARIEAKHYLTFRLSIDILEYEGELEQEDVDLEAIEEQQLLQAQSRQMFTSEPVNSTSGDYSDHSRFTSLRQPITSTLSPSDPLEHRHSSKISPPTSPMIPLSVGSAGHLMTATSATSATSATVSSTGVLTSSGGANLPTIEPALNFLNSTEDLLSADMDSDIGSGPGSVGMTYDLSKRRGSRSSETTTVKSGVSGNSGSTRSGGNAHTTSSSSISGGSSFMSSSVSIPMSGSDHGVKGTGHGGGSLMAGALGVLKKRGSSSTLPQQMHSSQQQQQQQQQQQKRLNRVNVQKLKDFVIRVPITIVLQGDEWDQGTNEPGNLTSSSAPPWQQNQYQSSRTRPVVNPSADTSSSLGSGTRSTDDFTSASSSSSLFLAGLKHHQGPPLRYGVGESITKTSQVEEEEVEGEFAVVDAEDDD